MDVYKSLAGQPKLKFKDISFEFTPDHDNRWVRLADLVPWEEFPLFYNRSRLKEIREVR